MDCAQEGDDHGTVSELDWLDDAEQVLSGVMVDDDCIVKCIAAGELLLEIPSEVQSRQRGRPVRERACKSEDLGFARDVVEAERVFDDALEL